MSLDTKQQNDLSQKSVIRLEIYVHQAAFNLYGNHLLYHPVVVAVSTASGFNQESEYWFCIRTEHVNCKYCQYIQLDSKSLLMARSHSIDFDIFSQFWWQQEAGLLQQW